MRYLGKRLYPLLFLMCGIIFFQPAAYSSNLDDIYEPLLNKKRFLLSSQLDYFQLDEAGHHGLAAYDALDSSPYFLSLYNSARASILPDLEVQLGYKHTFPSDYSRYTYSPTGPLNTYQEFNLKYLIEPNISARFRYDPLEVWVDYLRKDQKSDWNLAIIPNPTNYYAYNRTRYNNVKGGIRYLTPSKEARQKTNLSLLTRPLMDTGQCNAEASLEFEEGKVRRFSEFYSGGKVRYNYFHHLDHGLAPSINIRYGAAKNFEIETGTACKLPFRYKYRYEYYDNAGASNFVVGDYYLKDNFYFPFKCTYRPWDFLQLMLSSDFSLANQRLDYWEKSTTNVITNYRSKELTYYNVQPSVKLDYLFSAGKDIKEDEFALSTKRLLRMSQFLVEFEYKKDMTFLKKNRANGDQNIIDTHNLFLYPIDSFVGGTEYADFLVGNYTRYATNIIDQNYYMIDTALTYGMTDNLNIGAKIGYRSSSAHNNFTLHDFKSHHYKVSPYYFFDFCCNLRMTQNSLLSFNMHLVPDYTARVWRSGDPKRFEVENCYYWTSLALHILY